mmetsp:Transcript_58636/g.137294  ORF Transcript_58636/g.137294 Transcript_58636/m.137294 type:complete len:124 (+) Transcript_58636:85-456(+)
MPQVLKGHGHLFRQVSGEVSDEISQCHPRADFLQVAQLLGRQATFCLGGIGLETKHMLYLAVFQEPLLLCPFSEDTLKEAQGCGRVKHLHRVPLSLVKFDSSFRLVGKVAEATRVYVATTLLG